MSSQPKSFWWAMASAAAAVLGSFGPWAKVLGFISVSGTDGDGWIVIAAAGVAVALIILRQQRGLGLWSLIVAGIAAIIASVTTIYDWNNLNSVANDANGIVQAGWGIYIATIGSVSLVLACIGLGIETRSADGEATAATQPPSPADEGAGIRHGQAPANYVPPVDEGRPPH